MQEDLNLVRSDMCTPEDQDLQRYMVDYAYYDENTWEELDPKGVEAGERDELERFHKMGVYTYVSRQQAQEDPNDKFVKVKWVRVNKGSREKPNIRCRLVAQELGN